MAYKVEDDKVEDNDGEDSDMDLDSDCEGESDGEGYGDGSRDLDGVWDEDRDGDWDGESETNYQGINTSAYYGEKSERAGLLHLAHGWIQRGNPKKVSEWKIIFRRLIEAI